MAQPRRILVLFNPTSGKGRGARAAAAVGDALTGRGCHVEMYATTAAGDAERAAREAAERRSPSVDCVVACGGDGTVQGVANALASSSPQTDPSRPALGIAPAGRCNDFARALGIVRDASFVARTIVDGERTPIDLGRVNGRYFCTIATLGVDADITAYVDRMWLPLRGTVAYVYGAFRVLLRYRSHRVRITGDFGTIERPVLLASSANTASYAGSIKLVPEAVPTDGQLNLCVVDRVSRVGAVGFLVAVLMGRHAKKRQVQFVRTERIHIESPDDLEFWADGERIATTPADVEIVPGAIDVMLPPGTSV